MLGVVVVTENLVGLVAAFPGLTLWSGGRMVERALLELCAKSRDGRAGVGGAAREYEWVGGKGLLLHVCVRRVNALVKL